MSSLSVGDLGRMDEIVGESGTQSGEGCLLAVTLVGLAAGLMALGVVGWVLWALL